MKMTDFVKKLAEKQNVTKAQAEKNLKDVMECIMDTVSDGEDVRTSYGTFKLKMTAPRAAREGVNPSNPEGPKIQIPAIPEKKKISFTMSKTFKEELNS